MQHLGHINSDVYADISTYAVFGPTDNAVAIAYNGTNQAKDIHFFKSNGTNLCIMKNVQPGETQTQLCKAS